MNKGNKNLFSAIYGHTFTHNKINALKEDFNKINIQFENFNDNLTFGHFANQNYKNPIKRFIVKSFTWPW